MTIAFNVESGALPIPPQIIFHGYQGTIQPAKKRIEYLRRLGSSHLIKQDLGVESNESNIMLWKGFTDDIAVDAFIDDLNNALAPEAFYQFEDDSMPIAISSVSIIDYTYRITRGEYCTTNGDYPIFIIVNMTLMASIEPAAPVE